MSIEVSSIVDWLEEYEKQIDQLPNATERIHKKEAMIDFQEFIISEIEKKI